MKIIPVDDYVLGELVKETQTSGGILLPDMGNKRDSIKVVKILAVGPGSYNSEKGTRNTIPYKAGQTVLINRWNYSEVEIAEGDPKPYIFMSDEVIAILES